MSTDELVAFTVRVSADEHEALVALAKSEHRTLGAEVRRALIAHIADHAQEQAA